MKLRVELSEKADEEVVIRCRSMTKEVKWLQDLLRSVIGYNTELVLHIGTSVYYVPRNEILFFETDNGRITAHTADKMYYTNYKLYELEKLLPVSFLRVFKACILNVAEVSTIHKNLAGASEVLFRGSHKKVFVSRMYYKILKERIEEMRSFI